MDLLKSDLFVRYSTEPSRLREELLKEARGTLVIIDEVQKVPTLLDEVHWLIENRGIVFILCGSSARKLRRGHANLLGGRALRYDLHGLVMQELGDQFDLERFLNVGNLPGQYLAADPISNLEAYVTDYLKEEVHAESLVRNLQGFADFLRVAAICDTETIDYSHVASECGVKSATVRNHYQILEDTLLGFQIPAFVRRAKRRVIHSPKFYFANVGVVNILAKRWRLVPGSELFGKAFENWVINEIRAYNSYRKMRWELSYWRLSSGGEVDVVIPEIGMAIEIKSSKRVSNDHVRGLRKLKEEHPEFSRLMLVSLEQQARTTEDGIEILPATEFVSRLYRGDFNDVQYS